MGDHDKHPGEAEKIQKLSKLIEGIKIAMMTTVDDDDGKTLRSRPMATQNVPFDGKTLWFFTRASSGKVEEIERERQVNLAYCEPKEVRYASISGTAKLVRDKQKAKELWNPILKAYFPEGLDDPDLALLKVNMTSAEYWDAPSGKMVMLLSLAKAMVTGEPPKKLGEHERVAPKA